MLTKTDFMVYLDAPMHLWALKNQQLEISEPKPYDQYLMEQGIRIEAIAEAYLQGIIKTRYNQPEVMLQKTLTDGTFEARVDMVVYDREAKACDLYEIKSSTSVSKKHLVDVAFQRLVSGASLQVRDVYIVHLDKEYRKTGGLDIDRLFVMENVTTAVTELLGEIKTAREQAWWVANKPTPTQVPTCQAPKTCPCPALCHPDLPEYSIYDLTRLNRNKTEELAAQGIHSIVDLPATYLLSALQQRQAQAVKAGTPLIDRQGIRAALNDLRYPLHFLDFETCNPGIPLWDGYRPYQHIVFQYSLHTITGPDGEISHSEYLGTGPNDPVPELLAHLASQIGEEGSVIVWNQAFEASRMREMAQGYPVYSVFLGGINARIHDLMQVFKRGDYLHPDFHGSYSLKAVLPVLVPDFEDAYTDLPISKGDEAMLAWLSIISGEHSLEEIEALQSALLRYCALDSLAMVEIWKVLMKLAGEN